ncbi:MAG TPA: hypothetical protein P5560_09280 [Thermotogota bacterium]|nr:hypothetical protein [Thermotogota bacterium]HRW93124.1 hypothetical protein [Thermotogota bacterium]
MDSKHAINPLDALLQKGPVVVNMGMESFFHDLQAQEVPVVHVQWRPPLATQGLLQKLQKIGGESS